MVSRALFLPGMACGPYDVLQGLGRGLMAETHLARDRATGETVVLTCSDFAHAPADAPEEDVFAAQVAELVSAHVNGLARVIRGGKDGAVYWVAAEHVEGPDVRAFSRRRSGRHKAAVMLEAVSVAMIAADTLRRADAAGLTHGDLAPENIVMRVGGLEPVILGVGFARLFGMDRRVARRTPLYRAPEQLEGGAWDSRSDIYSLGMIMVELITGAPPFARDGVAPQGAELLALAERAMPESVSDPDHCPRYVGQVVRGSIHKDPARRYRDWSEVMGMLSIALSTLLEHPGMRDVIKADEQMKDASRALYDMFEADDPRSSAPASASPRALVEGGPTTVPPSARTRAQVAREVARAMATALEEGAASSDDVAEDSGSQDGGDAEDIASQDGGAAASAEPAPRGLALAASSSDQGTPPPQARRAPGAAPQGGAAPPAAVSPPPPAPSPPLPVLSPPLPDPSLGPTKEEKDRVTLSSIEIAGRGGAGGGAPRSERRAAHPSRGVALLVASSSVIAGALGGLLVFVFGHRISPSGGELRSVPVAERALDGIEPANPFRLAPVSPVPSAPSVRERATKTNVPIGRVDRAPARGEVSVKEAPAASADAVAPSAGKQIPEEDAPPAANTPASTAEPAPSQAAECRTWALCGKDLIEGAR